MRDFLFLSFMWVCLSSLQAAFAQTYTITDLGILPGGSYSAGYGVNQSGQVTGLADTSTGDIHAFLYSNGTMQDLGTLAGGKRSGGSAINASGQVTGWSEINDTTAHAFLFSNGTMQDLGTLPEDVASFGRAINDSAQVTGNSVGPDHAFLFSNGTIYDLGTPPGFAFSSGYGINNSNQVTGEACCRNGVDHAFLYSNGTMQDLGTLAGGSWSTGRGINDSGQITGWSGTSDGHYHAFIYSNGTMSDLGTLPGGTFSSGAAINNLNQVTGQADAGSGPGGAFLFNNGAMQDLNHLSPPNSGWFLVSGDGVNDAGQIVGNGINPYGQHHAFLLSPVETKSSTATTLATSLNPSIYGQKVTFTARVTTSGPVPPTGTVVFMWKYFTTKYTSGTATLSSAGVATLTKSNLNAGVYPMTALYKGDTNNSSSTSTVLNQTVLQTTTKATITSSLNPSSVGQAVTFTAKITSPTVMPTGPVTFTLGQTTLGTSQLSGGKATFTTSSLPPGSNVVKVTYLGNSNIAKGSAVVTQVVQP